jgi:hypothetical protein
MHALVKAARERRRPREIAILLILHYTTPLERECSKVAGKPGGGSLSIGASGHLTAGDATFDHSDGKRCAGK